MATFFFKFDKYLGQKSLKQCEDSENQITLHFLTAKPKLERRDFKCPLFSEFMATCTGVAIKWDYFKEIRDKIILSSSVF